MASLVIDISKDIGVEASLITYIMNTASRRYKVYEIKKRNGKGVRTIAQPAKEVKILQYWLIDNVLKKFPIHFSALAYTKGNGIRKNAELHKDNQFLLKMDFSNFFPSIKPIHFSILFNNNCVEELSKYKNFDDIALMEKLLFWNNKAEDIQLSIGAPSSPVLSNILMYNLDIEITKLCKEHNVVYSRYADDLTMSCNTKDILKKIESSVKKIIKSNDDFSPLVNKDKTVHVSKKRSRRITGLIISNDGKVSLGQKRKLAIKKMIYSFKNNTLVDIQDQKKLKGYIAFAKDIEPDFVKRMIEKYGEDIFQKIDAI